MRYMIIVKATKESEAGVLPPDHLLAKFPNPTLGGADCEIGLGGEEKRA